MVSFPPLKRDNDIEWLVHFKSQVKTWSDVGLIKFKLLLLSENSSAPHQVYVKEVGGYRSERICLPFGYYSSIS